MCGAVRYRVEGPLREVLVCHCVNCRRQTGRGWPATAARRSDLTVQGEVTWAPSPGSAYGARRGFCAACGTALFWEAPDRDTVSIGAGTLDEPDALEVAAHVWHAGTPSWDAAPPGVQAHPGAYPADAPPLHWA